jgi:hypothetical protein
MAYVTLPPNFQEMFGHINDRLNKIDTTTNQLSFEGLVFNTATSGTVNPLTAGITYFQNSATGNFVFDFVSAPNLPTNYASTCVVLITNGSTAQYPTSFKLDGVTVTPKWYPSAPTAGTANAIDAYTFTFLNTSSLKILATKVSFV